MPPRSLLSSTVLACVSALFLCSVPHHANAQTLIDFLWGGSKEWGGGKQTVSFNPKYTPGQIIVSFGDRRLYHITSRGRATSYPIAVPRQQSRWQGTTTVTNKRKNPSWRPTPEMLRENPMLPTWVPGGHRMNPLGVRALYLGSSAYRIHGTDAPWTIGKAVSKGCIRMYNEDVLDLYPRIPVGTRVTVTWERFSTTRNVAASRNSYVRQPYQPAAYRKHSNRRPNRKLPTYPRSAVRDAQTAAVRMESRAAPSPDERKASKPEVVETPTRRPKSRKPVTTKKAEPKPTAKAAKTKPAKNNGEQAKTAAKSPKVINKSAADATATGSGEARRKAAVKSATVTNKPTPRTSHTAANGAAEAARKAAAAAKKAAEAARQAAALAKKAAEKAKKATTSAKESDKTEEKVEPAKSAAL